MTQPESHLFVEIEADTKNFDRKLNSDVQKSAKRLEASIKKTSKVITESFDEAGRKIERVFTTVEKNGKVSTKILERSFNDAGKKIERTFEAITGQVENTGEVVALVARLAADSAADSFERAGERIEDAFREATHTAEREMVKMRVASEEATRNIGENNNLLRRSFNSLGETIVSLGSAIVGLGASAPTPAGLIAIASVLTTLVILAPGVIALGGALLSLVGIITLIPAAGSVALGAIIPLTLAFQNFGDAITAIASGDIDKINEALKKLSPSARSVAREFAKLLPKFQALQRSVQESFFKPLRGDLTEFSRLLPPITQGLSSVAGAFGRVASSLAEFFSLTEQVTFLNNVFATTTKLVDGLAPTLFKLAQGFIEAAGALLPSFEKIGLALEKIVGNFGDWLTEAARSGRLQAFLDDAVATLGELFDLGKAVGGLLVAIFGNASDEGRDFIQSLTDIVNKMTEFFKSAKGQQSIQDLLDTISALVFVLESAAGVIEAFFIAFTIGKNIVTAVGDAFGAIGKFFTDLWHDVQDIGSGIGDAIGAIGNFFVGLWNSVKTIWNNIINFFKGVIAFITGIPAAVGNVLASIPGRVVAFIQFLGGAALRSLGRVIGLILFAFQVLPGKIIDAVKALPGILGTFFSNLWTTISTKFSEGVAAVTTFVKSLPATLGAFFSDLWRTVSTKFTQGSESVISFAKTIPGRILNALVSLGTTLGSFFTSTLANAKKIVVDGFNTIVAFVKSVPGKIRDAFNAAGSFISDIGGDIADAIKKFLNKAIDKINSGIADIDNVLPGDLGRIPRLAKGGVIEPSAGGTLVTLAEAGEREIATPEGLLRRIMKEEGGGGINFEPGSISVSFSGAVPTANEAFRTGQAIGNGIISTLERQKIRTGIRRIR